MSTASPATSSPPVSRFAGNGLLRVLLLLLPLAAAAALGGPAAHKALRYERHAVLAGEVWRLLTAHLAHLGWTHLALNAVGLVLVALLFGTAWRAWQWALLALAASLGVGLGLLVWSPRVLWYVGLSGTAHGLFAAGAAGAWRTRRRSATIALLALAAKLAWEQSGGPSVADQALIGGGIVVDAHLYGAAAGLLAAMAMLGARAAARREAERPA